MKYIVSMGDDPEKADNCRAYYGDWFYPVMLYDSGDAFLEKITPRFV